MTTLDNKGWNHEVVYHCHIFVFIERIDDFRITAQQLPACLNRQDTTSASL